MDIKFPQQENPFPKTMIKAVLASLVALCVGIFIGYGMGAMLGNDQSMVNTTAYTDNMYAVKSIFMNADQLESYVVTGVALKDMDGLKLLSNRDHTDMMAQYNGEFVEAESLFSEEIMLSLKMLMNTEEALYGITDSAEDPIENVQVFNIAVEDGVVYYYLYYDEAGYIGLAYDSTHETLLNQGDYALPLTKTSQDEEKAEYEWFIAYFMED